MSAITEPIILDSTGQDIKDQISALNTKIQTLNTLLADLGLVSITPISQEDYDALSQAEKLAGVFDIYDAVEPDIDGTKVIGMKATNVEYSSGVSVADALDSRKKISFISNTLRYESATTFSYTGQSLQCPIGHVYIVRAWFRWANSRPVAVGACLYDNWQMWSALGYAEQNSAIEFILTAQETAYFFANYASVANNQVDLFIVDITV